MQVVFRRRADVAEVDVRVRRPDATVGDLAVALGVPAGDGLVVEGQPSGPDLALAEAGLHQGARVEPGNGLAPPPLAERPPTRLVVSVVGGLVAGPTWPLAGSATVGRDARCDIVVDHPTVSAVHCRLADGGTGGGATVVDLDSHNGTWLGDHQVHAEAPVTPDDVLRVGAVQLVVAPAPPDDGPPGGDLGREAGPGGVIHLNRPPRPAPPPPPTPLTVPAGPAAQPPRSPLSVVALLAPMGLAAVMVVVLGNPRFAVFALLTPVMVLGTWIESRRRRRKATRGDASRLTTELAAFSDELRAARHDEVARRRGRVPWPAELRRRAARPSTTLWERRPGADDLLVLAAGTGTLPWEPPLEPGRDRPAEADALLAQLGTVADVPVPVELGGNGVVGLVGDRTAALAVARSLVLQAATTSGPADVRVIVLTTPDRVGDWDWAKWLPHTRDPAGSSDARFLCADPASADALLRSMLSEATARHRRREEGPAGPTPLVVVDAEGLTEGRNAPARAVLRGEAGPVAGIVLADARPRLPSMTTAVLELVGPDGEARLSLPQRGVEVPRFLAAGVAEPLAREWARQLARFEDPELPALGAGLPDEVGLVSLLDVDPFDPASVAAGWAQVGSDPAPATPIGVDDTGVLELDLAAAGPHGLVVGTTGSGKSELLRALVAGLAVRLPPEAVSFLLFDYKGGSAFDACAELPHTVGVVTDLDGRLAEQALASLDDELRHRERTLRSVAATDLAEYRRRAAGEPGLEPLPRLVVVVDELAALAAELPDFLDGLVAIAERGRSLGIHLVLATQRATGSVRPSIKANTNLRIALRVQDGADSAEVVGVQDAARIPAGRVGRALVRLGPDEVVAFQGARTTGTTPGAGEAVDVGPFAFGPSARPVGPDDRAGAHDAETDLRRMVRAVAAAAELPGPDGRPHRRPRRLWSDDEPVSRVAPSIGLPELLGLADVDALDPAATWQLRPMAERLRVPLGADEDGRPLVLDIKESALGGTGPHGLVVGATGSGKSELLRTLVTALAVTHPPDQLGLVLVDFKGGATFAGMAGLPHVAGMITNLSDDLALVERVRDALSGELRRRQELLKRAGNLASVVEYAERREAGVELEPLPSLLVIVDEFAELLTSQPDFIDLFVTIGRLGRSLGVHLLLASQRLEEGRLRGLESHLSYRVGLRTFSPMESRSVLGVPDAAELPPEPGNGYLKDGAGSLTRFRAAFVSGPAGGGASVMGSIVERLSDAAPPVHQVWLPPLGRAYPLDSLLPPLVDDPGRPLAAEWPGTGRLVVPIGVVDRPEQQAQVLWTADLGGPEGNIAVVGAPRTGKSTVLRTLVASLALTTTPEEAQVYAVDFGGGGLAALAGLPHVGAVASRQEPERVRRVVAEVATLLDHRERVFASAGIDSVTTYRELRAAGRLPEEHHGDVFLVIDGWPTLRTTSEDLEATVVDLAARGLGFGIHVVVSANRWMEIRTNLRDSLGGRVELRLNDPADSALDRRTAANVPEGVPGRGLTKDKLHAQVALPRIDGVASAADLGGGIEALVARVAAAWSGPSAPPVRLLPATVAVGELPAPGQDTGAGVPIAVAEADLGPVYLDLVGGDPHLLVFGDGEAGKTTALRTFLRGLTARTAVGEAVVVVVDYRRTLLEVVEGPQLLAYCGAAPAATDAITRLRASLQERLPSAELTAAQLRDRSWWTGPECYVVVDDYDLVVTPTGNPLAPLLDFLPQAKDIGLHLLLARRVAGASRGLFEPVLQRTRELGAAGLVLSGDRQEGALVGGVKASEQPPGRGLLVQRRREPQLVQVAIDGERPEPEGRR